MSNYYGNYSQYLGAMKCCDLRTQGPEGPTGPTGPAGIGERGMTGTAGAQGAQGPTGRSCIGPTGPQGSKSFIINHPIDENRYLVHACLEGPESGVYYRGRGEISDDSSTTIELPYYTDVLATDYTVQVTPIFNGGDQVVLSVSEVVNGKFNVYGSSCKFFWHVYGKRFDIDVEPLKSSVNVKGNGPYLYI